MLKRRSKPRPTMDLRRQTQRETIARLLLLGWTAERISRKMHVTARAIRYHISTPEFDALYAKLQREHFERVERKLGSLLNGACDALERLLRHKDWRARDAALQHVFAIHGKYVQRYDAGQLASIRHVQGELVEGSMTDQMREKARELLALEREALQKQLPAKFQSYDPLERDRDTTGRFTATNGSHEDEE
jgi:hypothetical protein